MFNLLSRISCQILSVLVYMSKLNDFVLQSHQSLVSQKSWAVRRNKKSHLERVRFKEAYSMSLEDGMF
jgi:hypothetical protein